MFAGFQELVISVEDTARVTSLFRDVMHWSATSLPDAPIAQYEAWHVPPGTARIEISHAAAARPVPAS